MEHRPSKCICIDEMVPGAEQEAPEARRRRQFPETDATWIQECVPQHLTGRSSVYLRKGVYEHPLG